MSETATHSGTAVVCGGGVAGLSAAVALAQAGVAVTLIEQRANLGGRASSMTDSRSGAEIDNCQHVVMRACTALLDLYDRLGVADQIRWTRALHLVDPDDPQVVHRLEADDLPAPLHLIRPLMRLHMLTWSERLAVTRGMLSVLQAGRTPRSRARWNDLSFGEWLREHGQSARLVERFWEPIIVSACNEVPDRVATGYALQVFQDGLLATDDAYEVGLALCPLSDLYGPARQIIERAGGSVRTQTSVRALTAADRKVTGVELADGETLTADHYVLAVSFDRVADLLPESVLRVDKRFAKLERLEVSPIIGAHLYFRTPGDRPLLDVPHLMLPTRRVHWLFEKGMTTLEGGDVQGRVAQVHGVISAAAGEMQHDNDAIADLVEAEVRRVLGAAADGIERVHHRVIKERHATFSIQPGSDASRPSTTGAVSNLLVAGDWTDTGWPATMEGAARSGYAAATAALGGDADDAKAAYEREPELLYRVLAG